MVSQSGVDPELMLTNPVNWYKMDIAERRVINHDLFARETSLLDLCRSNVISFCNTVVEIGPAR